MSDKPVVHICGGPWGTGSYLFTDDKGITQRGYGFFHPENPHDFSLDYSSCSETEIQNHKKAIEEWDKNNK